MGPLPPLTITVVPLTVVGATDFENFSTTGALMGTPVSVSTGLMLTTVNGVESVASTPVIKLLTLNGGSGNSGLPARSPRPAPRVSLCVPFGMSR